jgi:formylmethanofuran dehydrogenase subunit B
MPELGTVTCAGCGLLCDDVTVRVSSDGVQLQPGCPLGARWFAERVDRPAGAPAATINGEPAELDAALTRAAELLRGARRPLVRGFDGATVEDARAAVALADGLGALVSVGAAGGPWPGAPAVPLRGVSTATLGEIRDRSGVVVVWREDPETTHPRLLERLGFARVDPSRSLIVLDDRGALTTPRAQVRLAWPRERDLEALVSLHAMQRELSVPAGELESQLRDLLHRLRAVPHAAFVYGPGLTEGTGGQRRALALHELVRSLSHERHVVTLELPRATGSRSADDVLAWQSGYGGSVDFAGGHPQPVTATQPLDGVDATVLVEPGPDGSLVRGPGAEVWIRTAAAGVESGGTMHRLDGVPLTLQAPLLSDTPTAATLLARLLDEVRR